MEVKFNSILDFFSPDEAEVEEGAGGPAPAPTPDPDGYAEGYTISKQVFDTLEEVGIDGSTFEMGRFLVVAVSAGILLAPLELGILATIGVALVGGAVAGVVNEKSTQYFVTAYESSNSDYAIRGWEFFWAIGTGGAFPSLRKQALDKSWGLAKTFFWSGATADRFVTWGIGGRYAYDARERGEFWLPDPDRKIDLPLVDWDVPITTFHPMGFDLPFLAVNGAAFPGLLWLEGVGFTGGGFLGVGLLFL